MTKENSSEALIREDTGHKQRFDALWWIVIFAPVLWWAVTLILAISGTMSWGEFLSAGFIFQGVMYGLQSVIRMLFSGLSKGYKKGHHIAFLVVGFFWIVLGIILIFVAKGI